MADELIENAEYGRKRKDEEPPILVAQRFLNIYRQMHIFNRERQEEFDNMLISTTPEVRILLSTLPGGGLLLEHISEIEQKKGVVSTFPSKQVITRKKDLNSNLQATPDHVEQHSHSGGGGVVIDASFASELSSSLSAALQQTEKKHKEEIKALTETITHSIMESQTAMVSMMRDILIATKSSNSLYNAERNYPISSFEPVLSVSKNTHEESSAPIQPAQPKAPEVKPSAPVQPAQPKAPEVKPSAPVQPVQPKTPEVKPSAPVQPAQPKVPEVKPSAPVQPVQPKAPEVKPSAPVKPAQPKAPEVKLSAPVQQNSPNNIYKEELDKIKSAIKDDFNTFDTDELISLDSFDSKPVSLDDINDAFSFDIKTDDFDSKPVSLDDIDDAFSFDIKTDDSVENISSPLDIVNADDEWEWEYVDDDTDSDEWEWEYVEDDTSDK